jgi:pilus assembly protein CpaC
MMVARDFFPTNVVNNLQVNGNQNIAIKVKVYEVSRTKLRQLGIDWSYISPDFSLISSVSQIITAVNANAGVTASGNTLAFGVVDDGGSQFDSFIQTLERHSIAKLLDQPVLVAQNGRPAEFLSGGEIPILIPAGLGTATVEFRAFGTKLDMVPIVHGNGELTLEVRAEVSEVANDLASTDGTPGFRVRRVNTGVKMKAGHTLALAGDYREDHTATKRGIPGLMHSPVFGPLFRNIEDESNETELVFLITPRFISDVDPAAAPKLGPGQMTTPPSSRELMIDGYLEVPRCAEDCVINDSGTRLQNQFSNQAFQSNGVQTMPASYPQIGSSAKPNLSPYPSPRQVQQAMAKAPTSNNIMPASFEQAAQQAGTKKNLLQRIGIQKSNGNNQPQAAGNGFAWPADQQNR